MFTALSSRRALGAFSIGRTSGESHFRTLCTPIACGLNGIAARAAPRVDELRSIDPR
jgi:hypothetical protein